MSQQTRLLILQHWDLANARRWSEFGQLLHPELRYEAPQSKWWMDLYVDNVADGRVRTNAGRTQVSPGNFIYLSQYLPPRVIGVNFGFGF